MEASDYRGRFCRLFEEIYEDEINYIKNLINESNEDLYTSIIIEEGKLYGRLNQHINLVKMFSYLRFKGFKIMPMNIHDSIPYRISWEL